MGRCGTHKTKDKKANHKYATKTKRRFDFELPHSDVLYKAVQQEVARQARGGRGLSFCTGYTLLLYGVVRAAPALILLSWERTFPQGTRRDLT